MIARAMNDWDPGSVRAVKITIQVFGLVAGLLFGHKLLTIGTDWFDPGFRPQRWAVGEGFSGFINFQAIADIGLSTIAAGVFGIRLSRLAFTAVLAMKDGSLKPLRPSRWVVVDVFLVTVLGYLTYAANTLHTLGTFSQVPR